MKISRLPVVGRLLDGTERLPIAQDGETRGLTLTMLLNSVAALLPAAFRGAPGGSNNTYARIEDVAINDVPDGTDLIWIADQAGPYVRDARVTPEFVAANPDVSVIDANGAGFRAAYLRDLPAAKPRRLIEVLQDAPPSIAEWRVPANGFDDGTAALNKARASGARYLRVPRGVYRTSGWRFDQTDQVSGLEFETGSVLLLDPAPNRAALDIQKPVFHIRGDPDIRSFGLHNDGLQTYGVRHGSAVQGHSYLDIDRLTVREHFSAACFATFATVNIKAQWLALYAGNSALGSTCSAFRAWPGESGSTMIQIVHGYINGGRRGLDWEAVVYAKIGLLGIEYSGSSDTMDGAWHLVRCGQLEIGPRYGEQNHRNMVIVDTVPLFIGSESFAGYQPDQITYFGVAHDDRGATTIVGNEIQTVRLGGDRVTGRPLRIGRDILVDHATGRARIGRTEVSSIDALAVSGVWTTIFTLRGQNGDVSRQSCYDYVIRLGAADKSVGIDCGSIFGGQIYSRRGVTPDWLRIDDNALQVLRTDDSYGLTVTGEIWERRGLI